MVYMGIFQVEQAQSEKTPNGVNILKILDVILYDYCIIFFKLHKLENWQLSAEVYGYQRGFKF